MIWVFRKGALVPKTRLADVNNARSDLPSPLVSRLETYESPVTGKDVSSWRQRDKDMQRADAIDPRDIPQRVKEKRREIVERNGRAEPAI